MTHSNFVRPLSFRLSALLVCVIWGVVMIGAGGEAEAAAKAAKAPKASAQKLVVAPTGAAVVKLRCPAKPRGACRGTAWVKFQGLRSLPTTFQVRAGKSFRIQFKLRPAQVRQLAGNFRGAALQVKRVKKQLRTVARLQLKLRQTPPVGPVDDDLPAPLPADVPDSDSFTNRNWSPTAFDTCPASVHDRFSVVGPDGKRYPTWHPPAVTDPATGEPCTFGHEHGADPRKSDLYDWVAGHLSVKGYEEFAGIPFGFANEQLIEYAEQDENDGTPKRFEDHVGHKIDFVNDVTLVDDRGEVVYMGEGADREPVVCDYMYKLHQGTHSLDATTNNVHELIYATRCSDETELLSTAFSRFGAPGEFNRSCHPYTKVQTVPTAPFPAGGGERRIADRTCIDRDVLVKSSGTSTPWSVYETWNSENELLSAEGEQLAYFDPDFAVFDPSRYRDPANTEGNGLSRMLDLAWTVTDDFRSTNADPWTRVSGSESFAFNDPRSPFTGARREFFLKETTVANEGGPKLWWTDPWGENGSTEPFPGAICQLIGSTDNSDRRPLGQRLFSGASRDYNGDGVHAPN